MKRVRLFIPTLMLASIGGALGLAACEATPCQYGGNCQMPAQRVCDAFGKAAVPGQVREGLKATLSYFSKGDATAPATPVNAELYFNEVNVPARNFFAFVDTSGAELERFEGGTLESGFNLHFESLLKLGDHDLPGRYQLAVISDDGATLDLDDTGAGPRQIVDGGGSHPALMSCATETIELRADSRIPLRLDYHQTNGQIALMVLWRPIPDGQPLDSAVCGTARLGLSDAITGEGWQVLAPGNYELDREVLANPCNTGNTGKIKTENFAAYEVKETMTAYYRDVDLLWVVDNSISMKEFQSRITRGLVGIARNFFESSGDREIRMSVITTDNYLAGGNDLDNCYARLVPGFHDGNTRPPLDHNSDCTLKDPLPRSHTGLPILSTRNAAGQPIDPDQLAADFAVNAKVGLGGSEERGLQSVHRFLKVNEERDHCRTGSGSGCLFRKNTVRGVIFLSDEHSADWLNFDGETVDHRPAKTQSMSDSKFAANADKLADLMRRRLNSFFRTLDGSGDAGDPNYFIAAIVHKSCYDDPNHDGSWCGLNSWGERAPFLLWGREYTGLANAVKNDSSNSAGARSIKADITERDYSGLLHDIGQAFNTYREIIPVTMFTLSKAATRVKVTLILADGTRIDLPQRAVQISGANVMIVDPTALPSPLPEGSTIEINYL